jgi:hypothetical protein
LPSLGLRVFQTNPKLLSPENIGLDKSGTYQSALARRADAFATPEKTDQLIETLHQKNINILPLQNPSVELRINKCCVKAYLLPLSPLKIGPSTFMRPRAEDTWAEVGKRLTTSYYPMLRQEDIWIRINVGFLRVVITSWRLSNV